MSSEDQLGEDPPAERLWAAWEDHAPWWQENFTAGADPEYEEQILPLFAAHLQGAGTVADLGTGEGQLARLAAATGAVVVGLDPSAAQIGLAAARGGGPHYVRADAANCPFASESFDAISVCLVLEHIADLDPVLDELSRLLRPGGRLLVALNHPLLQTPGSGWIDDHILQEQYWRIGSYLKEEVTTEEVSKGIFLTFVHRPLSAYINGLARRGLFVTLMEEPAPPAGFLALAPEYREAANIPRLAFLRAEKLGVPPRRQPEASGGGRASSFEPL